MHEQRQSGTLEARYLLAVGFNHARVPVAVRERYALSPEARRQLLGEARQCTPLAELVILSTCNRFEVYAVTSQAALRPREQVGHILRMIWPDMPRADFDRLLEAAYWFEDAEAARHLFRTASGLDSMVIGEAEINGQVKAAYEMAHDAGGTGPVLNRLFQNAFSAAKRVRTDTEIGHGFLSVGTVAARSGLAASRSYPRGVLVMGAGQMGRTIARCVRRLFAGPLYIANRTAARAQCVADEVAGTVIALEEVPSVLEAVDVVFAAANSPGYLLTARHLQGTAGRGRPAVVVDVCVPRSVEPALRVAAGVQVLDLDDLQVLIAQGEDRRRACLCEAESLVLACVEAYWPRLMFVMGRGVQPSVHRRGPAGLASCR